MNPLDAILRTQPEYAEAMRRRYLENPASVPVSWAAFFAGWDLGAADAAPRAGRSAPRPGRPQLPTAADGSPIVLTADGDLPEGIDAATIAAGLRVYDLVHAHREHGHLAADLDPLGRSPRTHPLLDMTEFGITEGDLAQVVNCVTFRAFQQGTLADFVEALRATYCEHVGIEFMGLDEKERRDWLIERMEPGRNRPDLTSDDRRAILRRLVVADSFEEALGRAFPGGKRFSLEGGTTLIPLLDALIDHGSALGVTHVVMGMAHRGRLNVLAQVLGKPLDLILAEFEGRPLPPELENYGDVKYHLGWTREHRATSGQDVELSLEFNPSHLETVNPVVEGIVRAQQNRLGDTERTRVVPVLMHGDAAMTGQGVVAETFLLGELKAYSTGGTIHVVINNQVGFTTDPDEGRTARYCTDIARVARAPVFHVNGDDPEACVHVARLAIEYRQRFRSDVVIDLTCYRRHGHNELDDPTFTQPVMYSLVKEHESNSRLYAQRLVQEGVTTEADVEGMRDAFQQDFDAAHARARALEAQPAGQPAVAWAGFQPAGDDWTADTTVPRATLDAIARALVSVPDGFTWHPRLERLMRQRRDAVIEDRAFDWGTAEALAIGALLVEGTKVRLTGQDAARGTFSHRHAVYVDHATGERHVPLNHVQPEQNIFMIVNSPLSEEAVLGFEYGYSTADPHTLTCWEAQFGDFVNGAQVIIDQLIASCEFKWGRMSGLVLLLPHGYEGQGPEHSSARLERFLELCAEKNLQVCNLTTPAQYFHVLRRQARRNFRRPLVIMTPKSLLRHELAVSRVSDLEHGGFHELLGDPEAPEPKRVERVLLCSGKIFWTLFQDRRERRSRGEASEIAMLRLEQLYPFPDDQLRAALSAFPRLSRLTWVQEEPQNMGAWRNLRHRLEACLPEGVRLSYAGRHSAAVPATGSQAVHAREERELLEAAFTPGGGRVAGERQILAEGGSPTGELPPPNVEPASTAPESARRS